MEKKIREYVDYQFRFDNREGLEELKEEIIANLIDRYNDNLKVYNNEDKAYVEAIKHFGDFSDLHDNVNKEEFTIKPSIPDILLLCAMILSIFGLVLMFYNLLIGAIITMISIVIFSSSAYYLFQYSQYVRETEMDIKKHNVVLRKIFKFIKTSFIFWTISLSVILANIITAIIVFISGQAITLENISGYIAFISIIYIISLVVFIIIFKIIYDRLMDRYYYLTGDRDLKSSISDAYQFISKTDKRRSFFDILNSKFFLPLFGLILLTPSLFIPNPYQHSFIIDGYEGYFQTNLLQWMFRFEFGLIDLIPIAYLIFMIVMSILTIIKKENKVLLTLLYLGWFFLVLGYTQLYDKLDSSNTMNYLFIVSVLLSIITLVRYFLNKNKFSDFINHKHFLAYFGFLFILPSLFILDSHIYDHQEFQINLLRMVFDFKEFGLFGLVIIGYFILMTVLTVIKKEKRSLLTLLYFGWLFIVFAYLLLNGEYYPGNNTFFYLSYVSILLLIITIVRYFVNKKIQKNKELK